MRNLYISIKGLWFPIQVDKYKETYEEWEASNAESSCEKQQWSSHVPLIPDPGTEKHDYGRPSVRGSSQHLGLANGKPHILTENNGKEVS